MRWSKFMAAARAAVNPEPGRSPAPRTARSGSVRHTHAHRKCRKVRVQQRLPDRTVRRAGCALVIESACTNSPSQAEDGRTAGRLVGAPAGPVCHGRRYFASKACTFGSPSVFRCPTTPDTGDVRFPRWRFFNRGPRKTLVVAAAPSLPYHFVLLAGVYTIRLRTI